MKSDLTQEWFLWRPDPRKFTWKGPCPPHTCGGFHVPCLCLLLGWCPQCPCVPPFFSFVLNSVWLTVAWAVLELIISPDRSCTWSQTSSSLVSQMLGSRPVTPCLAPSQSSRGWGSQVIYWVCTLTLQDCLLLFSDLSGSCSCSWLSPQNLGVCSYLCLQTCLVCCFCQAHLQMLSSQPAVF